MNDSSHWRPLSQRRDGEAPALPDDVPRHLHEPVIDWVKVWEAETGGLKYAYLMVQWSPDLPDLVDDLSGRTFNDNGALLDVLDAILEHGHDTATERSVHEVLARELDAVLRLGGSAWRVADNRQGLTRRVDTTVTRSFKTAAASQSSAADYLAEAWRLAYDRNPNPGNAYNAAIKAVEAAAVPVVSPKNRRATLGSVIRDIEAAPQIWRLAITRSDGKVDLAPVLEPMRLLWQGQTDRHGSGAKPVRITPDAAVAAVHVAVMLVHWFQAGFVTRTQ